MGKIIISLLLLASVTIPFSDAHSISTSAKTKAWRKRCPITGLTQLRLYIKKNEYLCYAKLTQVQKAGLTPYSTIKRVGKYSSPACELLGVTSIKKYFSQSRTKCFASEKAAKKKKYAHLVPILELPAPTPTPIPTSEPTQLSVPTPTPLPKDPITVSFNLSPVKEGSGYLGQCTATLNDYRNLLSLTCSHNVPNAIEAHLHIIPHNEKSCELANPASEFSFSCVVTAEQAVGIENGTGLIAIHTATGVEGEALAGFIRNN